MNTDSILSTLLAAAAFLKHAVQDVAGQAIKDAYDAVKAHLRMKFNGNAETVRALDMATDKPESLIRKALLAEETASFQIARDTELVALVERLATLLPSSITTSHSVRVKGSGNRVQVAGRDLIQTTKLVRRNAITPDERHITVAQREQLRRVIGELAERLRSLNPGAYQNDLYRAVFAGARELGWDGEAVDRFAGEKLGLKNPLTSLKELGPVQLKSLADCIRQEVRAHRDRVKASGASAA